MSKSERTGEEIIWGEASALDNPELLQLVAESAELREEESRQGLLVIGGACVAGAMAGVLTSLYRLRHAA